MSAGAVVGIILGVLVVVAAVGFLLFRMQRAKQEDDEKHFTNDYPSTKAAAADPTCEKFAQQSQPAQQTPTEYDFTSMDVPPSMPGTNTSSIAMLHANPHSPSPAQELGFHPGESTVAGHVAPGMSPPFRKEAVQASRPSQTNFEAHSIEFTSATAGSYAESYNESYAGSFAGSYANSFSGTYNGQGMLNSFDMGSVADPNRETVGTTVSEALERDHSETQQQEQSHWMDEMRDTQDSYAMLESGSFDRTSALSRFSTDSDLTGRPTQN